MTSRYWGAIFIEELHKGDWYHKTSQAFVVFLPVKFVGVVGDTAAATNTWWRCVWWKPWTL